MLLLEFNTNISTKIVNFNRLKKHKREIKQVE